MDRVGFVPQASTTTRPAEQHSVMIPKLHNQYPDCRPGVRYRVGGLPDLGNRNLVGRFSDGEAHLSCLMVLTLALPEWPKAAIGTEGSSRSICYTFVRQMRHEILQDILSATASGTYTTRELIKASGYSPNTVIRYLDELEGRGLVERIRATKIGRGRPPIILRPTQPGLAWMREDQIGVFRKLHRETDALWGPRQSLSFWGVPFYGTPDVFARKRIDSSPFELVVEKRPALYENPVENDSGVFPSLESLAAWVSASDNPRYIAAAAVLLNHPKLDVDRIVKLATRTGSRNRLGFLASVTGAEEVLTELPSPDRNERMLARSSPVDEETVRLARRWKIVNPVSRSVVKEMLRLYGSPR